MKINESQIENWKPPGDQWWNIVRNHPDKPLIKATLKVTLSWTEYKELISRDTKEQPE